MYHWDLPVSLQELGGWANPNIIEYFKNYADFLFKTFGSQVSNQHRCVCMNEFSFSNKLKFIYLIQVELWSTINEPRFVALAYGNEGMAPSVGEMFNGISEYMVIRNLLLAHAAVYRLYKKNYAESQKGKLKFLFSG